MTKKNFLRFDEIKTNGKTKKFNIYSAHSDDYLGEIHWDNGWRHYVVQFDSGCIWSLACINQLKEFLEELEND